jgi:hypothetical protein
MTRSLSCLALVLVLASTSLIAKGPTTRIRIRDLAGVQPTITIVDPSVLSKFNVWDGPGTYSGPPGQQMEGKTGFIIDWQAGPMIAPESTLPKYEVQFFVRIHGQGDEKLAYVVQYQRDVSGDAFVYLPGRGEDFFTVNVRSIHRRLEGRWFRASNEWQQAVNAALH